MQLIDLTGKRFGKWVVLHRARVHRERDAHWLCHCDCGQERVVSGHSLKDGNTQSCGCLVRIVNAKHGDARVIDGRQLLTKEYRVWANMKTRCYDRKYTGYHNYGGRGIRVCKRWRNSYLNFLEDMGRAPSAKHSIDRRNNNGNYTPSNCRWATRLQQNNNQRKWKVT